MSNRRLSLVVLVAVVFLLPTWLVSATEGGAVSQLAAAPQPDAAVESLLGPEQLISWDPTMPETDRYAADLAFNWVRGEYLVVWHNNWPGGKQDIYARRVALDGRLLSWFAVSDLPNNCLQPAVAYDAANAQYLVVWMYDVAADSSKKEEYEIWGRIIDWNGPGNRSSFQIMSWSNRSFRSPRVVWNHNRGHYLVVWNAFDTTLALPTGLPNDIAGRRVYAGGGMDASATIFSVSNTYYPQQVDLAYSWSKDEWFIAYVRSYLQTATSNDIYGRRIAYDSSSGALLPGAVVPINTEPKHQNAPAVVVDGLGGMMVVFEHEYNAADHDIYGQELDASGNKVGAKIPIRNSTLDEVHPDVTASFDASPEYVAVWQEETATGQAVRLRRWGPGLPLEYEVVSDVGLWESTNPAIAGGRPNYLTLYAGESPGDPTVVRHIYGRKWVGNVAFLPLIVRNP